MPENNRQYISKQARLFRSGTYPGKGSAGSDFVVTREDLHRIAKGTTSAAVIHAHDEKNERLDYGTVDGSSLEVRGDELWGTLQLEESAVPFLEMNGLKSLSAGIPFDKSRLQEVSFTRRPVIEDAAMFSQESPGVAFFSLVDDADVIQEALATLATFAGKTISTASSEKIVAAHDALSTLHPECCPANKGKADMSRSPADERKPTKMNFWKRQTGKSDPTADEEAQAKTEFSKAIQEVLPAPIDNTAQFAQERKSLRTERAEAFADKLLYAGKIAAEADKTLEQVRADVIARFCEAAEDDDNAPRVVTFSEGGATRQGTRLERFKAEQEAKKPVVALGELMPGGNLAALFNKESSANDPHTDGYNEGKAWAESNNSRAARG